MIFQFIEVLDQKKFQATLESTEEGFELKVLAQGIYILSRNVPRKHLAVNIGFGFAALNLVFFVMAAVSYSTFHFHEVHLKLFNSLLEKGFGRIKRCNQA